MSQSNKTTVVILDSLAASRDMRAAFSIPAGEYELLEWTDDEQFPFVISVDDEERCVETDAVIAIHKPLGSLYFGQA